MKEKQDQDPILLDLKESVHNQRVLTFQQEGDGVLKYQGRLCVPNVDRLQDRILQVAHLQKFHSSGFYQDVPRLERGILV